MSQIFFISNVKFIPPSLYQRAIGIILGLILLLIIVNLIRSQKLKENLAFLWILCSLILIIFCIFKPILKMFTILIGAGNPVVAIFAASIFFIVINLIFISVKISKLTQEVQELAIENAILKKEIENNKKNAI